jgi:hypothetical protein
LSRCAKTLHICVCVTLIIQRMQYSYCQSNTRHVCYCSVEYMWSCRTCNIYHTYNIAYINVFCSTGSSDQTIIMLLYEYNRRVITVRYMCFVITTKEVFFSVFLLSVLPIRERNRGIMFQTEHKVKYAAISLFSWFSALLLTIYTYLFNINAYRTGLLFFKRKPVDYIHILVNTYIEKCLLNTQQDFILFSTITMFHIPSPFSYQLEKY